MASSAPLPGVFILDAHEQLLSGMQIVPVSALRAQTVSQLLMQIVMHLLLDAQMPVPTTMSEHERMITVASTFAGHDIGFYRYAFTDEVLLNLYQWYFETYVILHSQLNHYFPNFEHGVEGLPYTVKLYDTLLRFDHIPPSRDYSYVSDRTT
jgi:hypothetical protein